MKSEWRHFVLHNIDVQTVIDSNCCQLFDQNVTQVEDLLIDVELEAVCAGSLHYLWL